MNSGVHLGYAWLLANTTEFTLNERRAVAIAGVAADADGLAILFGRRAFYKCSICGEYLCPRHRRLGKWQILCEKCLTKSRQEAINMTQPGMEEGSR